MSTTIVELRTEDEVIRLLMKIDDMRGAWKLRTDQTRLFVGATTYSISPGVILNLIDSEWLIPANTSETYELDHEREDEWVGDEVTRKESARSLLLSRHPKKAFRYVDWTTLHHPESADQDTRGFVFTDNDGYEYLVCEGGRIHSQLKKIVAL